MEPTLAGASIVYVLDLRLAAGSLQGCCSAQLRSRVCMRETLAA